MARNYLGDPVHPDWGDRLEYWKFRKRNMDAKQFMYVFDLKEDRCILAHGMSFLGYEDSELITSSQLLNAVYEDHRKLFSFQVYRIHQILFDLNRRRIGYDYNSCGVHAINDANGKTWLVHYTSEIFQYDANGLMRSYLSWCHVICPYRGEPLHVDFYHRHNNPDKKLLRGVLDRLDLIQEDQLRKVIGFTDKQIQVLKSISAGNSIKQVAENFGCSVSNINKHTSAAREKAMIAFPLKVFKNYRELVDYLSSQRLI